MISKIFESEYFLGGDQERQLSKGVYHARMHGGRSLGRAHFFRTEFTVCFYVLLQTDQSKNEVSARGSLLQNRVLYRESLMYIFYMGNPQ
jgi:hypothetical protein